MKLTNNSTLLLSYFIKNDCIKESEHSEKTQKFLKKIYKDLNDGYKYVSDKFPKSEISLKQKIIKIEKETDIPNSKNYGYKGIPVEVLKNIKEKSKCIISYTFSLYERIIKVQFIDCFNMNNQKNELYNTYVESILVWLYIVNKYASKECSDELDIYLYFTQNMKNLPNNKREIIGENNVNTAFTSTCPVKSDIVVFRKEEWFKVFIHETFHNFELDFSGLNDNYCTTKILELFPVASKVNLYEAYTETWAEIMNALFCSYLKMGIGEKSVERFLVNSEFFLYYERNYSFFQMVKILDFMGLDYKDLYLKGSKFDLKREKLYKEGSSVLSYYIVVTILMSNYESFLQWCSEHNGQVSLYKFKPTEENMKSFCELIEKNYKSIDMLENVECSEKYLEMYKKIQKNIIKNKKTDKSLDYILENTRMTICELG